MYIINNFNIYDLCQLSIKDCIEFLSELKNHLNQYDQTIAEPVVKEILIRLQFLSDVGLTYITLNRRADSLSGGEAQRIRLASQIGSGLSGVIYVLDEPSIGLHSRDTIRLIGVLRSLQQLGNTLIVVEHDEEILDHPIAPGPFEPTWESLGRGYRCPELCA